MTIEEDLALDGPPEQEYHAGVATRIARKRVAAGALIRDCRGRILLLEPTYKPYLDIPGGIAEEGEAPLATCRREVREELGLALPIGRLLLVDWVPAHGVWGDGVMFVFDGGVLTDEQTGAIRPNPDEAAAVLLLSMKEATSRLRPSMARRLVAAANVAAGAETGYAEFGRVPPTEAPASACWSPVPGP